MLGKCGRNSMQPLAIFVIEEGKWESYLDAIVRALLYSLFFTLEQKKLEPGINKTIDRS